MSLKDILVHLDGSKRSDMRLEAAIDLAQAHEAHLAALYMPARPHLPPYLEVEIPESFLKTRVEEEKRAAAASRDAFDQRTRRAALSAEWREREGEMLDIVAMHARYADLVVIGQTEREDVAALQPEELPESLALTAGRPVLVMPYVRTAKTIGQRIVVAWNASREATRALNDAMPLLTRAKHVTILAVNPSGGLAGHGQVPGMDIALHLARHGVKAEAAQIRGSDIEAGDMLLSRLSDLGADLLVMGAYGHSRLRELVLGGVTRHVLRHMTVPVVMSH